MPILDNYIITPTAAGGTLTVALKTLTGDDPSVGAPVVVRIGGVDRYITSALSVTVAAGANTFNAGSSELATIETDYFVYLGYNATDGVVLGISRIPYANVYSDFSATATNEKYCKISTITNAAAGDNYVNIGRFAATLSAGAGYTWTVPTYTGANLIQKPIYETQWLSWTPAWSNFTVSSSAVVAKYKLDGDGFCEIRHSLTWAGSAAITGVGVSMSMPLANAGSPFEIYGNLYLRDTGTTTYYAYLTYGNDTLMTLSAQKVDGVYTQAVNISATVPFTWVNTDIWGFHGSYPVRT